MDAKEEAAFWERYFMESPVKDIEVIDSAARQLVAVTSLLQGIYFAAIALSDFKKQAAPWQLVILVTPAALWLVSLLLAMLTFVPVSRRISRDSPHQDLMKIAMQKCRTLWASFYILLVSMALLLVNIVIYLNWILSVTSAPLTTPTP